MSRLTGLSTQQSLGDCLTLAFSKNTNGTDIRLRDELIYNLTIGFNQRAGLITMSKTRFYYLEMLLNNFPEVKKAVNDFFQQHYQVANFVEQLMTLYQGKNGIHCYSLQQLRGTPSGGAPVYARPTKVTPLSRPTI